MEEAYREIVAIVEAVPAEALAVGMLAAGVALLFFGWHLYRIAIVAAGVLMGGLIGTLIAVGLRIAFTVKIPALVLAIPLGVVMGFLALKIQKVGAFIVGGLCIAIPILAARSFVEAGRAVWIAAAVAFILGGVLAVLLWRPMIVISLAVIGSKLIALGTFGLFDRVERFDLRARSAGHPYVTAGILGVVTLCGVLFQMREDLTAEKKSKKKPKDTKQDE